MHFATPEEVEAYERWYATPLGSCVDRFEKKAVLELLPPLKGLLLLDAGCGIGNYTMALADRGARVISLDRSPAMLARAGRKTRESPEPFAWLQGDLKQLPFPAHTFAGVISILALDFIASREAALLELSRVLRPGGVLVLGILNRFSLWTLKRVVQSWFGPSIWREVNFLGAKDLIGLVQQTGRFHEFRWGRAIYFPPVNLSGVGCGAPYWERLGALLYPGAAAFLALAVRKRPG